ncbi:glutaminyl-peptide cyclotransferase [Polaribacter sp. AHE13PA]|uniref:glutaminyl-peptide cyclotransferase n=1 Tax=Polaribacter sp. AHE13PA TaxID=2745562 RepID=UPI001C4EAF48|nr:glutaminyl-peptide cyclotransferase [Polaribacter sp. AHE13PA]QXP67062.1 glutaminyl-peptide cyclotransferase [Polaribacter sp. AHE13PA]
MKKNTLLVAFFACFLLITSCSDVYKFSLEHKKQVALNSNVEVTLKEKEEKAINSVQFFVNGNEVSSDGNAISINTTELGVGKHQISALVFYAEKTKKENSFFEVLANKKPVVYDYKIINEYPHDKTAYTQGLEYHDGFLYETTGQRGKSTLRKVEIETGKVLQKIDLDKKYFGEGMTILNNKIYWLTWQAKKGFVYNLETFKQEKEFAYNNSAEGWGFTHNGTQLIKSDGTNKIWFLDPETLKEEKSIQVYTNKYAVADLNELELINGKIYANKYQQNAIVVIDPKTGVVEGIANLKGLHTEMEKTQKLVPHDEVLNGIAYDKKNNRLFVTGKHWGKLFEIELIKKQ